MSKVTDPRDLLVHDLGVVYAAEKLIEAALPKMAKEANDDELGTGFERHLEETREHVSNLEEVFRLLGEKPQRGKSPAVEGLTLQHKGFAAAAADDVQPEVLDLVALGSAAATEHHEISAYESLITLAEGVGETDIVPLLERNLDQERNMLARAKDLARRLGSQGSELDEDLRLGLERERQVGAPASDDARLEPGPRSA
ncbi:MAG: ferritin-like domain-containing protein [Actinobacteria bacterium]|nr:ferritin-like domain-containing protein [Actinomycetota bacterium]